MRNYKKEFEWQKERYIAIRALIEKDLALKLKKKLKEKNKTTAEWIRENAKKYTEENI